MYDTQIDIQGGCLVWLSVSNNDNFCFLLPLSLILLFGDIYPAETVTEDSWLSSFVLESVPANSQGKHIIVLKANFDSEYAQVTAVHLSLCSTQGTASYLHITARKDYLPR